VYAARTGLRPSSADYNAGARQVRSSNHVGVFARIKDWLRDFV